MSEIAENQTEETKVMTPSKPEKKAEGSQEEHDPYYAPIVSLPKLDIPTMEEDEDILFKARAKLYRFDKEEDPPEWKERGLGEVKLLKHTKHGRVRVLMRREKVLKLCANHYVQKYMILQEQSEKAWVWRVMHECADEEPKDETLAIRFKDSTIANEFKTKFEEAQDEMPDVEFTTTEDKTNTEDEDAKQDITKDEEDPSKDEEGLAKDQEDTSKDVTPQIIQNGKQEEETKDANIDQATDELNKLNVKEICDNAAQEMTEKTQSDSTI